MADPVMKISYFQAASDHSSCNISIGSSEDRGLLDVYDSVYETENKDFDQKKNSKVDPLSPSSTFNKSLERTQKISFGKKNDKRPVQPPSLKVENKIESKPENHPFASSGLQDQIHKVSDNSVQTEINETLLNPHKTTDTRLGCKFCGNADQ